MEEIIFNEKQEQKRIKWVDCARAVAMIAVVVDHCRYLLYTSSYIAQSSFFSVSLFILLAGISVKMASLRKKRTFSNQFKKFFGFYLQYAAATLILYIFYMHFFDVKTYVSSLLNFSIATPYYFLVFYFQLMLAAPFLLSWCEFCNSRRRKNIWHLGTTIFLCYCSSVFVRYTFVLPVHGGGKYLFGGTYLILYYLGILFANSGLFHNTVKQKIFIFCGSFAAWIFWWLLSVHKKLPFDAWLEPYLGNGFNPPGVQFMVFSIITLFVLYSLFSLLQESTWTFAGKIVDIFAFLGKYTLYIFLYHLMVKDFIVTYLPFVCENMWVMRFCIFFSMIILPVICARILEKGKAYYVKSLANTNTDRGKSEENR